MKKVIEKMADGWSCCGCNRKGRCLRCTCVQAGRLCSTCLPGRQGQCANISVPITPICESTISRVVEVKVEDVEHHSSTAPSINSSSYYRELSPELFSSPSVVSEFGSSPFVTPVFDLPQFETMAEPSFVWGLLDGPTLSQSSMTATHLPFTGESTSSWSPLARLVRLLLMSYLDYLTHML